MEAKGRMKTTKKFLAFSAFLIAVCMMVLLAALALSCLLMLILALCWCMWKDALVAFALCYLAALGGFSFLDTADWFLNLYRRLKNG